MPSTRLATLLANTIREQRHLRELSQCELADAAGISQAAVARIENGNRTPSIAVLEALLAAMDVQLVVGVEPLDAHLDARIDDLAVRPIAERIEELGLDELLDRLPDFPQVLTGSTAALLQGAPVPVDAPEIALRWQDSKLFTRWLEANYGQRWNARWSEFGGVWLEPEEPGEHRWSTTYGEIRAIMCDELPETIEVRHGQRSYQVVPLVELELTDARAAELLRRYRDRQSTSGG
ncbi:helix-turn-helix transcriptional regulator [Micromonospora sp. WMMD967]|uniref:helix-turn-helix domain-containing protein n=1 Tax=Micromonospora sp. WMMD967 TaxID=3016101 RepID=UPI00241620BC|nr:helix-turn-helix transcriptional regulator [Micromonospora sp. WMMD967]MDG4835122.1 helix-turn-helix transcriptional regulator [Micromonospora sp. WMMD967]